MVTWNALEWSRRAMESIVEHTDVPYELIIVDNASNDGTREFLANEIAGARILLNDDNLGFAVAANLGAARARASVIVFVNSDLIVARGWIEPLCLRLDRDPRVAAVGPKILNLDGRLDHAGGLLAHDGWTMHYGAGDDPQRPEYSFARPVEYATGACLAVRARAFHEAGGFDPWFQMAYFEDADLCLRLRAYGLEVVYEPASIVTHAGGASGTADGSLRLLAVNHPRFQQRWRHVLQLRPIAPLTDRQERILGARDAIAAGTILLIADDTDLARQLASTIEAMVRNVRIDIANAVSAEWLAARRFHYDIVAGGDAELAPLLRDTQPQALRLTLDALRHSIETTLLSAGIAT